eukprot:9182713-Ditylum_brightwellii.AAC.1
MAVENLGAAQSFGTIVAIVDAVNGYNEIMYNAILEAVWDCPDLRGSCFSPHKSLSQGSYIGLGSRAHITTAPFTCEEGVQ